MAELKVKPHTHTHTHTRGQHLPEGDGEIESDLVGADVGRGWST